MCTHNYPCILFLAGFHPLVKYDLPADLSFSARQCIKNILTDKSETRYTIGQIRRCSAFVNNLSGATMLRVHFGDAANLTPPVVPPKPKTFNIVEPHKEQRINRI